MLATKRSVFSALNIAVDTESIASNCNSITFDNEGNCDCQIYINDTEHAHTGGHIFLGAGKSIDLGGRDDSVILDVFDIVFTSVDDQVQLVNVITETFQILT